MSSVEYGTGPCGCGQTEPCCDSCLPPSRRRDAGAGTSVKFTQVAIAGVDDNNNMIIQCNYVIVALDTEGRIWERPDTGPWCCVEPPKEPAK